MRSINNELQTLNVSPPKKIQFKNIKFVNFKLST